MPAVLTNGFNSDLCKYNTTSEFHNLALVLVLGRKMLTLLNVRSVENGPLNNMKAIFRPYTALSLTTLAVAVPHPERLMFFCNSN